MCGGTPIIPALRMLRKETLQASLGCCETMSQDTISYLEKEEWEGTERKVAIGGGKLRQKFKVMLRASVGPALDLDLGVP